MRARYEGSHFMQLMAHTAHSLVTLESLGLNTRGIYTPGSVVITMPGGGGGRGTFLSISTVSWVSTPR